VETFTPVLLGYLIGALPVGFALTQWLRGVDLRRAGSGNPGATNAYRTAGLAAALLVMGADVAKGAGTVLLAARFADGALAPVAAGVAAIIGHVYPAWWRFRGGKGVATAAGVFAVLTPIGCAMAAAIFIATVWITRYVSLGSVIATAALPPLALVAGASPAIVAGGVVAAVVIILRHRPNLARLHAGTEYRLGERLAAQD
jgi:acyl phosphate:glycerol-3-phosphate acyltransferase